MNKVTSIFPTVTELRNPPPTVIKAWLVENVRGSLYNQHIVVLYHLRPINGKKANKASFRMTHEIIVSSVPSERQISDGVYPEHLGFNVPPDMNIQFVAENDQHAAFFVNALTDVIKTGVVSVTKEYFKHWISMLEEGTKKQVFYSGQKNE